MEASNNTFWVVDMPWPGIEPLSPGSLANTSFIMPMGRYMYVCETVIYLFWVVSHIKN